MLNLPWHDAEPSLKANTDAGFELSLRYKYGSKTLACSNMLVQVGKYRRIRCCFSENDWVRMSPGAQSDCDECCFNSAEKLTVFVASGKNCFLNSGVFNHYTVMNNRLRVMN